MHARASSRSFPARSAVRRSTCSGLPCARCCRTGSSAYPGRTETIFSALCNVDASHLADPKTFDFRGLDQRRLSALADSTQPGEAPAIEPWEER